MHSDENLKGFALGLGYNSIGGSVLSIEVMKLPSTKQNTEENTKNKNENSK